MEAEFIAVDGPLLGERFPLGSGDVHIGRAPSAQIRLTEVDAAWEHCTVQFERTAASILWTTAPAWGFMSMECGSRGTAWSGTTR